MSRRAKVQNWGSEKRSNLKERGLILPVERRLLKLWARRKLSKGRTERKSKDRALEKVAKCPAG